MEPKRIDPWPLLRGEKIEQQEEGLRLARRAYKRNPYGSESMQLGVALLWLGRYTEAWHHFEEIIRGGVRIGDNSYGMAGVSKWCLDRPDEAVLQWRAGLRAKYARASGLNITLPMLLFFAVIQRPDCFGRKSAEEIIRVKTGDPRIHNWPGPIAKLIVDQLSERQLYELCASTNQRETANRIWLSQFYLTLKRSKEIDLSTFEQMRKLADTENPEWQDQDIFLSRIWSEEFFLARHEGRRDE